MSLLKQNQQRKLKTGCTACQCRL